MRSPPDRWTQAPAGGRDDDAAPYRPRRLARVQGERARPRALRDRRVRPAARGGVLLIGQITAGEDVKIIKDLGLATIELAGVLMTVFIGVGLVAREIDRRSIYSLLAKPLPRWEFIVGKYLGLVLTIVVNVAAMTAALYLMLAYMDWSLADQHRRVLGRRRDRPAAADRDRC